MNGRVFEGLSNLKKVFLNDLECMSENFEDPMKIATISRIVTEKCGFAETTTTPITTTTEFSTPCANGCLNHTHEMFKVLINRTEMEREKYQNEIVSKVKENAETLITLADVKGQLALAISELAQAKSELKKCKNEIIDFKKNLEEKNEEILSLQQRFISD